MRRKGSRSRLLSHTSGEVRAPFDHLGSILRAEQRSAHKGIAMKLFNSIFGGGGGQPTTSKRGRGVARARESTGPSGTRQGGAPAFKASANRGVGINSAPGAGAKNAANIRKFVAGGGRAK